MKVSKIINQDAAPFVCSVVRTTNGVSVTANIGITSEGDGDERVYSCTQLVSTEKDHSLEDCLTEMVEAGVFSIASREELKEVADAFGVDKKQSMLSIVKAFDKSTAVNEFTLGGNPMWLTLEERKNMRQSIIALKANGVADITYWYNGSPITMSVEQFEAILNAVEVYAIQCYNVTAHHIANVNAMEDDVLDYDYTTGYPDKLAF